MLSTGIVRNLDNLGHVVLPKELRYSLDMQIATTLEIFVDEI
jgi:Regulators of stationary/sporulation gene expression